ncbi:MAG TPA: malto-oligosyltrehalose trehalohydrolase [Gemmatimonadaceae bacterium]
MANPNATVAAELSAWRRYPVGVEIAPDHSVHARVWAPRRQKVVFVHLTPSGSVDSTTDLDAEGTGYFSGTVPGATDGTLYKLRLDEIGEFPDPASRYQPLGPHGPSRIVDARRYSWGDADWRGPSLAGAVIYELHVGTFTAEGTYAAATTHLAELADIGVSVLELMPLAEFPGRFGWGYDGVALFAPHHAYGQPDDLRAFIDAAHRRGIAVLLDVVYNHLGPAGNYLKEFSNRYFHGSTEWGEALNFGGHESASVREYFVANAAYWIEEFHFDGLRLDATQQIFDTSRPHILSAIATRAREAASGRATIIVAENEPQDPTLLRHSAVGGCELDALWNDDFHHTALVALTGRSEAYLSGYRGVAQEFVSTAKYGFLYQGEWLRWQRGRRGGSAFDIPPARFVNFVENHDQVANSAFGRRAHQLASPSAYRAIMALLLLLPQTPMLFQGQEFLASAPFLYFADHAGELATRIARGRMEFLGQFAHLATAEIASLLADPMSEATFLRCKLDWSERHDESRAPALALVRDLIRLRRSDVTFRRQGVLDGANSPGMCARAIDGATLSEDAFVLRYFGEGFALDRLVAVNLGRRLQPEPLAEPLVAPPAKMLWRQLWSSESPVYGGCGTPSVDSDDGGWALPAESTIVLAPVPRDEAPPAPHQATSEREARAQWKARHETTAR